MASAIQTVTSPPASSSSMAAVLPAPGDSDASNNVIVVPSRSAGYFGSGLVVRPEMKAAADSQAQDHTTVVVNRAKALAGSIRDQLAHVRTADQREQTDLVRLEDELQQRRKDIEMHMKNLQHMRDHIEELSRELDQENGRAESEFAGKLQKIETFRQELGVVDALEKRLKDSTARVEHYKERLEGIRHAIEEESKRQIDVRRRTNTQQSILLWGCVAFGALALVVGYAINVYR
ncbi:hypothetical protein V1525DRAFT_388305 [Lipomyces kononenkoae]|uniref:Uncharacterized protein n=1 Tax=Lipomyces kononenkoae TaxID=34357 RepID=A0ACC3T184_LIPKO